MDNYINPEIEVLAMAQDVISSSITYDDNETAEDLLDDVLFVSV